jgi:hypothetical protein
MGLSNPMGPELTDWQVTAGHEGIHHTDTFTVTKHTTATLGRRQVPGLPPAPARRCQGDRTG